jgi:hypothetical protein
MLDRKSEVRPHAGRRLGPRTTAGGALTFGTLLVCATSGCSEFNLRGEDNVEQDAVSIEETAFQDELAGVDILWVVDDTSSMAQEQSALGSALRGFAEALESAAVSWQVGVISTEASGEDAGVLQGDPWIMTSSTEDLPSALARAAAVGTAGSPPEAGLGAAVLALSEAMLAADNRGFRRPDAALHIVVVSDTDDDSTTLLGDDPAGAFLSFLDEDAANSGRDALFSAVVGPVPAGCSGNSGSALPAPIYAEVVEATGGTLASICESDLTAVASSIAESSQVWPSTFALQATPLAGSLRVAVDGVRVDDGWTEQSDPPAVVFDAPPAPGAELGFSYEVAP